MKSTHRSLKQNITRVIEYLGYVSLLMQWVWVAMLFMPAVLEIDYFQALPVQEKVAVPAINIPFGLEVVFMVGLIVLVVGISAYFIVKTPAATVEFTARKIETTTDRAILPVIERRAPAPLSPKERDKVRKEVVILLMLVGSLVPLGLTYLAVQTQNALPDSIAFVVAYAGVAITTLLLILRWLFGRVQIRG